MDKLKRFVERVVTTGEEMPDCDAELFKKGKFVTVCGHSKQVAEDFRILMQKDGFRVDWYFGGVRKVPIVVTFDDVDVVLSRWKMHISHLREKGEL